MKHTLIVFLLIPTLTFGQIKDTAHKVYPRNINLAGKSLVKFYNQHSLGVGLSVGGDIVLITGALMKSNSPVMYVGGAISLVGTIITLHSYGYIRLAGEYLTDNGITIPLDKPRKHKMGKEERPHN